MSRSLFATLLVIFLVPLAYAEEPNYTRKDDVIYGRKFGIALTLDVFTPKQDAKGLGIIFCCSGGWFSDKRIAAPMFFQAFINRGYTVFAVVHGSQPKFTIPEILDDMHRAVRYVRHHAKEYAIDPTRIGVTGGSAGGHLSLMLGTTGKDGDPKASDPVDRESSKVQAVACFFPPTDFLNYGKEGNVALGTGVLTSFKPPFDFTEQDPKTRSFVLITDEQKRKDIGKKISPVYQVTQYAAPTLIVHGDADQLVPIQQAERMIEKLKEVKVPCELVIRKNAAHGWAEMERDLKLFADWFDKHLVKQ